MYDKRVIWVGMSKVSTLLAECRLAEVLLGSGKGSLALMNCIEGPYCYFPRRCFTKLKCSVGVAEWDPLGVNGGGRR